MQNFMLITNIWILDIKSVEKNLKSVSSESSSRQVLGKERKKPMTGEQEDIDR